jgi:hypothetical protein
MELSNTLTAIITFLDNSFHEKEECPTPTQRVFVRSCFASAMVTTVIIDSENGGEITVKKYDTVVQHRPFTYFESHSLKEWLHNNVIMSVTSPDRFLGFSSFEIDSNNLIKISFEEIAANGERSLYPCPFKTFKNLTFSNLLIEIVLKFELKCDEDGTYDFPKPFKAFKFKYDINEDKGEELIDLLLQINSKH